MKNTSVILIIAAIGGIAYCFTFFSKGNLTANEQVLFSILLTIASLFLSWVVSHFYYEKSHEETIEDIKRENQSNLKIYASKAAEKVRNLSAQLLGLVTYLNEELASEEYDSPEENLRAKEERIYSAVHIIKTLKSINDGSLSDWSGIIPEAIEEIAEEERENVEKIHRLISDFGEVKTQRHMEFLNPLEGEAEEQEDLKIEALSKKIDLLLGSMTGVSPKPLKSSLGKIDVEKTCPVCNRAVKYKQKPLVSSRKSFKCPECKARILSTWNSEEGFALVKGRVSGGEPDIPDEKFIELVRSHLPEQPWPKKIGDSIAHELAVSSGSVHRVINILISRGIFKHQVNGVLYVVDPTQHIPASTDKDSRKEEKVGQEATTLMESATATHSQPQ